MNALLVRIPAADAHDLLRAAQSARALVARCCLDPGHCLSLEEAWAGLHFTLTGELPMPRDAALARGVSWDNTSLENALLGGTPLPHYGTMDGPLRYLAPDQVATMAAGLSAFGEEKLALAYDPEGLMDEGIPPDIWGEERALPWLRGQFVRLVAFYAAAALAGDGVLTRIAEGE